MRFLITGGAGFIGSAVVRLITSMPEHEVLNVDKLTYAGNLDSLKPIEKSNNYHFSRVDICDRAGLERLFSDFKPQIVMHLAAESHVDRSIEGPDTFIHTNIVGTFTLLEVARKYYTGLTNNDKNQFRFHHISTDEVFGDLDNHDEYFHEETAYAPSSPYSASKASSDHLVRAWHRTYGLPTIITNCSNNYGPYHFPEKLIPKTILNAIHGKSIPIYGDGSQIRDWLYVDDHARALLLVATHAEVGKTYNIGGHNECTNLELVTIICDILNSLNKHSSKDERNFTKLITFVNDRPGHDTRYAIDASKIENDLNWKPQETLESGLKKTIQWYLDHRNWWEPILNNSYRTDADRVI